MPNSASRSNFALPLAFAVPLAIPLSAIPQATAAAVTFTFDFARTVPEDLKIATREAADEWSLLLKDDAIVKLRVDYSDLAAAGSVLGGVQPGKVKVKYEDYTNALLKDAISSNDFLGISNLQLSAKGVESFQTYQAGGLKLQDVKLESKDFAFLMDGQFAKRNNSNRPLNRSYRSTPDFLDNNGNDNNKHIQLTRAQAKALGLLDQKTDKLDAVITINSNASWDFDRSDGIERDRYDAMTVVQHEIGHALGLVSGVDTLDFLASTSQPGNIEEVEKNKFSHLTPMDFYRYSDTSAQQGVIDLTLGGDEKYFSLDGGKSAVTDEFGRAAYFSTGSIASQGDGYQGSHWKASESPLGVMNPFLQPGQSIDISQLDLTLLDVVGWNLTDSTAERAAAIGVDWAALRVQLTADRQAVVKGLLATWGDNIPALEVAINDASSELELKFQQKIQEKLDSLIDKVEKEPNKRRKEVEKFYKAVAEEAKKRNSGLRELPKNIEKIDRKVREWLSLPTDKLSQEMEKADANFINRLSNIVKALPVEERAAVEAKIKEAVAPFADESSKLVQDLLDSSGPANPIGWSYFRWYWWWLEAQSIEGNLEENNLEGFSLLSVKLEEESEIFSNFNYNISSRQPFSDAQNSPKDVPEPSSMLAVLCTAAIGFKLRLRVALSTKE